MAAVNGAGHLPSKQDYKITFYTNHGCPWAHRSAITLHQLGIPYDEVIIPLDKPREPWYLEINPRGLVPSIKITGGDLKDEIVTESAIVSTFLADLFPHSTFYPSSAASPASALARARMNFFVDTWFSKVNSLMFPVLLADDAEKEKLTNDMVAAVEKEIEPLLEDAGPFFGGSSSLTYAEALTGPFVIRFKTYAEAGLIPKTLLQGFDQLPNYSKWSQAVCAQKSVTYVFDGPAIVESSRTRIAKMKEAKSK